MAFMNIGGEVMDEVAASSKANKSVLCASVQTQKVTLVDRRETGIA
jgi:hypothetical protein